MMLLTAGNVAAQVDPDPDGMSVYFDTEGLDFCYETSGTPEPETVTAYLLLTRPTADQVVSWEARVAEDVEAFYHHWTVVNDASVIPLTWPDLYVYVDPPLETDGTPVVLAYLEIIFFGQISPHAIITVDGIPGSLSFPPGHPGYAPAPGVPITCNLIHDSPGDPVAWINHPDDCDDIIASGDLTWGAVKRLY